MVKLYRVKDWNELYENNRTRELKSMAWVPVPNSHDGDGYTELVDRKNGAAMLGAWLAILQVASRCGIRGTLSRQGATPHDARSLARMTRIPVEIITEALDVLTNQVKWLISEDVAEIPHFPAPTCGKVTMNGMEWKGTEQKEENGTEVSGSAARTRDFPESNIPTKAEVLAEADIRAVPKDSALSFFTHHDDNQLWVNQFGRLINWKSKLLTWATRDREKPKPNGGPSTPQQPSVYSLTKIIEAKKAQADGLKSRWAVETGLDTTWTSPQARQDHRKLKTEIKQLTSQLAGMA